MRNEEQGILPYLAKYAVPRIEVDPLGGFYCEDTAMWMLNTTEGPRPAIEYSAASSEMRTKTEVEPESDDDFVLELLTKTMVQDEQDENF